MLEQSAKAERLLALHTNGILLVLPNIWNPIGARVLEATGYPAVATASAAISASLGYDDGERIARSTLIEILARIVRSVDVPVTADIESGYGETVPALEDAIMQVLDAGVAGINIEDSTHDEKKLRPYPDQCERIASVRSVANRRGVHLVINARIDSFLSKSIPTLSEKIEDAVARAKAYVEAGADCVYPIGPGDRKTVAELRSRIAAPINILASPGAVPLPALQEIGINRVSFGSNIFRSCLKKFVTIVESLHSLGGYESFGNDLLSSSELTRYLMHHPEEDSSSRGIRGVRRSIT